MKWKTWAPAVIAIALGGVAAKLARDSMSKSRPTATIPVKAVLIATSSGTLQAGQEVRQENIAMIESPTPTPPPDAYSNPADVLGRYVAEPIGAGETFTGANLTPRGAALGLQSLVPSGMRAITINVDEGNSQAGMMLPGSHVDVISTLQAGKETATRTLVKNVLVQGVGQRLSQAKPVDGKDPGMYHTITLIVTPHEAEVIELANISTRLRLLLRGINRGDETEETTEKVTMFDILGAPDTSAIAPVAATQPTTQPAPLADGLRRSVELYRGSGAAPAHVEFLLPKPTEDVSTDVRPVDERSQD